ncbi:MAG: hypothetical protein IT251_07980 [Chitinophagaceae bacterium]|nr:hypothetical protein [Chitinophagaceae bacterium]
MKKYYSTLTLLLIFIQLQAQKQTAAGLISLEPDGIVNIITDMTLSPDNKTLFLTGYGGRAYLYDATEKGKIKPIWKNSSLSGLSTGAICSFSQDGKYIMIRGLKSTIAKTRAVLFSNYPKSWQKDDDVCVLDAVTGNTIFSTPNAYAISISNNTAFVSDKDGFKFFSLPDGKLTKTIKVEDNEYAAISPSGKYIVESWDADKQTFKDVPSIVHRRTELKNAYRAKKILVIYETSNLDKPIAYSNDEIDVVTNMQFSPDEKFVYLQMQLAGQENSTVPNPYAFQRVNIATGEIDKSFGIKANYCKVDFENNKVTSLVAGGNIGLLKQVRVQDMNNAEDLSYFETRYKFMKTSTMFSPIALVSKSSLAYVYYEKNLYEWDYKILKKYFKKGATATDEELAIMADSLLDASLEDPNSKISKEIKKKEISGNYIMDITITGPKGAVATIFCESDEKTNIPMQNALKDIIKKQEFDLNLPKNKRLKFRYTFQL